MNEVETRADHIDPALENYALKLSIRHAFAINGRHRPSCIQRGAGSIMPSTTKRNESADLSVRVKMRRCLFALGLLLFTHAALAAYTATSSRGVDLSGHWRMNVALSDDAEHLLQKRLADDRKRREALLRRARAEGELFIPPDPDDDSPDASGPREPRAEPRKLSPREMRFKRRDDELRQMLGISSTLDIKQSGAIVDIESQVDARRFEAGVRSQVSMPQGELADSNVGWDGEWFVIERKARGGPRVVEKYRWLKQSDQLESVIAWGGDSPLSGIKVHRIYDRAGGAVNPPDPAQGPVK